MTGGLFKRKVMDDLVAWMNSATRKPLVIRGARQVGKTSVVRHFAATHAKRFAELNLERLEHAEIFRRGLSLEETIQTILLECRVSP